MWEQRKLLDNVNDVLDYRGKSPKKFGMEWGNSGYLVLSALNVKNGYIDMAVEAKYGSQQLFERWMGNRRLEKGDVVFTTEAPLGNVAQIPDNNGYILNQRAVAFKVNPDKMDNNYLAQLLRSPIFQSRLQANSSGGTAKGIGMKEFAKMTTLIPKRVNEQQKIGTFFKQLDNTIALHQCKIDALKRMKKGFLQQMFPTNEESVPRVRFADFEEKWELSKLGNVTAAVFQGINTAGDKVEYSDIGTPILQAKHITGGAVTFDEARFLDKERYSNYFPKYVPVENDILFANIGTIGPSTVVRDESEFLVAWNILKITLKKPEIAEFIQLQIDQLNQKHYFDSVLTGNATKFVNKDEMLHTPILVPMIEEQKKVGAFFSNIQRAITLHQQKLDQLKALKKAYLQNMFI
ncbi:type I restriction enzyme, S subunit [Enterococcus sp. DIV0176]|uniref:restriction endonuclease subunit S n=1 Tax=Enterococcus sp. DIV0176 TaxID=2774758 RepID=UPI003D2FB8D4